MRSLRLSIARLMAVVLILAIGFSALRNASYTWFVINLLVTCFMLAIACVGAICRKGAERAFWSGFAIFGSIYIGILFEPNALAAMIPEQRALAWLGRVMGIPIDKGVNIGDLPIKTWFLRIGHCLCTLLFAGLGAFLGRMLFGAPRAQSGESTAATSTAVDSSPRLWWIQPLVFFLSSLLVVATFAVVGARFTPGVWSGLTFFVTCLLLGIAAVGGLLGRGRGREAWLGASVFGAGFLALAFARSPDDAWPVLPTAQLLEDIYPWVPFGQGGLANGSESTTAANARIRMALEKPVAFRFPEETPLDDVLKYVQEATAGPDGKIIPIYVDPIGLAEADKTMTSTVRLVELDGVCARASLRYCLAQLDLEYVVKDGLLLISTGESISFQMLSAPMDAFQVAGHCVLALIAAGIGGLAAPFVCDLARRRAG